MKYSFSFIFIPLLAVQFAFSGVTIYPTIDEAIARGDLADVETHLSKFPDSLNQGKSASLTPLHQAILRKQRAIALHLIKSGADVDAVDKSQRSPLHLCVERDLPDLISALLLAKAKPDTWDKAGWTPLHNAAAKDRVEVAKALIAGGAKLTALSERGGTALHEAAASASSEMVELLLSKGLAIDVIANDGRTALEVAQAFKNKAAIRVISEQIARLNTTVDWQPSFNDTPVPQERLQAIETALLSAKGAFFGDPPDEHHPWAVHDQNRPLPPVVTPAAKLGQPPSDAIVLFDGTEASFHENWRHNRPADKREQNWIVIEGALQSMRGSGNLSSLAELGDCQLHIEWRAPTEIVGQGQGRGNSGVFFMGDMVEVQVLDNYENPTYADGTAGAVYGLMPPAANALRPSGEWQSYDIIFRRPIVREGVILDPGSLTVLQNGVVIQENTPLAGGGGYKTRKPLDRIFPELGALMLQDHGNPVRFRNIWYRPLRPRALDGGSDGRLSKESTLAKRSEIAAELRQHARTLEGQEKALRLLESLKYEEDADARAEADNLIALYAVKLQKIAPLEMEDEKKQVLSLDRALHYMHRYKLIPNDYPIRTFFNDLAIQQGWKKDK